jgi:adenosine kinase
MANKKSKVLVVGSIAYDVIFAIHGDIKNEIPLKDGQIDKINLMFTAKNKERYFGGTAGNIAYGLGQLGEKPLVFSVAGGDFIQDYSKHLKNLEVQQRIIVKDKEFSATFYGISDEEYQQIGIWQPNAYGDYIEEAKLDDTVSPKEFEGIEYAIFSPGTGISTRNHMLELKKKNKEAKIIFDPSQVLSIFYDKKLLLECLSLTDILISNDTEIAQFETLFGLDKNAILDIGVEYVIETRGGDGSIVFSKDSEKSIPPKRPKRLVETTGAGDAFRAGLLYGLANDNDIETACRIGAYMGAKSVEEFSGQLYSADLNELKKII